MSLFMAMHFASHIGKKFKLTNKHKYNKFSLELFDVNHFPAFESYINFPS